MSNRKQYTNRGFRIDEFKDINGFNCSIQQSSLATKEAIWLGCEGDKYGVSHRMEIDKRLARWLIKKLEKFIKTGNI